MATEVEPPELARLLDLAERPRAEGWSLRAAITRYGQPQPQRASEVIELVRRSEYAISGHAKLLEREGPAIWDAVDSGGATSERGQVVALLQVMVELDRLGDTLADWASDRSRPRPDDAVDAVVSALAPRLDELGVAREERPRPVDGRPPPRKRARKSTQ